MFRLLWLAGFLLSLNSTVAASFDAPAESAPRQQALRSSTTLGSERLRLPADERMGLLGASYLIELKPGWWLGPALYGAATGRRGGLFTWGAEGQRRWHVNERWLAVAGLYVGGGGGAAAPVGGGLMLRPHVDLMRNFGRWSAGISASRVRFPSGEIQSTQLGLLLAFQDKFEFVPPGLDGQSVEFAGAGGLNLSRVGLVAGRYATASNSSKSLDYVGTRLEHQLDQVWSATLEAAGAAGGGADGYAEFLGGVSALWPLADSAVRLGAHAALGLGGGGGVPTGGGPIAKVALASRLQLSERLSVAIEAGRAHAFNGDFSSRYAQASIGMTLGPVPADSNAIASHRTIHDMEWALSSQHYSRAQRKDGSTNGLSTLGLKFQRSLSERVYLSGQAHSAVTDRAGAYSVGLVGIGVTEQFEEHPRWRIGAEAMVGAAGGGGVTSGGAIVQPMAWLSRALGRYSRIKLGVGFIKSVRAELSSPVVDLTWAVAFGVP